uniref:NADH dehydrogenase subunit 6 n=1 Tax=Costapex baldwinae TaxID=2782736 RepID=A0A7S6U9K3_9CAEN|nr:NADH dehydrogenase subunit 6 [Costapex baldwinae]
MTTLILFSLAVSGFLILPLMIQPLSLGLVVMFSTLFMCMISALMLSSWYGFILFLIYVGGLLVMFAYVAALSPNVLFGGGYPVMIMFLVLIPMTFIFYSYYLTDLPSLGYLTDFLNLKFLKMYGTEMVSPQMISILVGLAIILLINLVVVVKICYYQHASLRPFSTQ